MKRAVLLLVTALVAAGPSIAPVHTQSSAADEARLLRFPAIHGNQVVFTYAGDLYTVPVVGGRRAAPHERRGFRDVRPVLAGREVHRLHRPVRREHRGVPDAGRRRHPQASDLHGHAGPRRRVGPHGPEQHRHRLEERERRSSSDPGGPSGTTSGASSTWRRSTGGPLEEVPLPRGGFGSFSPDGRQFVYNRVFREFRTWKRYRGGQADDVWLHDFATKTTTNLTTNPAQDIIPMWRGSKVYFASDRDERGRMNLYSYDMASKQTKKLTTFTEFDVKFPSLGDDAIVFENGGWIYRLDLASEQAAKIPVRLREDFDSGRGAIVDVSRSITNYEIAPDGSRALFGARGDVFTVPAKFGPTRNLTRTPGVHERNSKWSPDGRWIAYISDATGEDEIWIAPQDGRGAATQITTGGSNYKYQPVWSPDSKKLMWSDRAAAPARRRHRHEGRRRRSPSRGPSRFTRLLLVARQPVGRLCEARGRRARSASISIRSTRSRPSRPPTPGSTRRSRSSAATASCCSSSPPAASTRRTGRPSSSTSTPTCRGSTS